MAVATRSPWSSVCCSNRSMASKYQHSSSSNDQYPMLLLGAARPEHTRVSSSKADIIVWHVACCSNPVSKVHSPADHQKRNMCAPELGGPADFAAASVWSPVPGRFMCSSALVYSFSAAATFATHCTRYSCHTIEYSSGIIWAMHDVQRTHTLPAS